MSNTANDEQTSKKRRRDDLENENSATEVDRIASTQACPVDFPISRDIDAPTSYDEAHEIVALMKKFGKQHNVSYANYNGSMTWWFVCKGCEYVQNRFKSYAKLEKIIAGQKLDVPLVPCPKYPSKAHGVLLVHSMDHQTSKPCVYAIDYSEEHVANCNWKGCRDSIPIEEMPINEVAKATARAICKRIEAMVEPHHEGYDDGLTNIQLAQIEVLDRVLTDIESVL